MTELAAIHARLDAIEALLKQLVTRPVESTIHSTLSTDEEIILVQQQGIDPVAYLRSKQRKREAQTPCTRA